MSPDIKSLRELCLDYIIREFSRFSSAYVFTEDEVLRKNLKFLQRVYTQYLFSAVEMKEEYFDFLLNEHLKRLELVPLLKCSTEMKIIEGVLPIAHTLTELSIKFNDYWLYMEIRKVLEEIIPHCINIQVFNMPTICNNHILKLVSSSCPKLSELYVKQSFISGKGMRTFVVNDEGRLCVKCPLKHLDVSQTCVTEKDVFILLRYLPTLEEIHFPRLMGVLLAVLQTDIKHCEYKSYNLRSLDFTSCKYSPQFTSFFDLCADHCPNVRKLSMPIFKSENLDQLNTCFPNLENIVLEGKAILNEIDVNRFLVCRGKRIKEMMVSCLKMSVSTLIENCPIMEKLSLKNIRFLEFDKSSCAGRIFNKLLDLKLNGISTSVDICADSVMVLLNASPQLESLSFAYSEFGNSDLISKLSSFSLNCHLKHLQFEHSDVSIDLLEMFVLNCSSLETVCLRICRNISSENVRMLNQAIKDTAKAISINFVQYERNESVDNYDDDYYGISSHDADFTDHFSD